MNYSAAHDNSMMNASSASNTSYNRVNKSNRVTPPCPVRIPKEVTDGIHMLKAMRLAREGYTNDTTYMTSNYEESKSPGSFLSDNNVSYYVLLFTAT